MHKWFHGSHCLCHRSFSSGSAVAVDRGRDPQKGGADAGQSASVTERVQGLQISADPALAAFHSERGISGFVCTSERGGKGWSHSCGRRHVGRGGCESAFRREPGSPISIRKNVSSEGVRNRQPYTVAAGCIRRKRSLATDHEGLRDPVFHECQASLAV